MDELIGVMMLNVVGVVLGCKHGVPALRRNGGGAIVNTASAAGAGWGSECFGVLRYQRRSSSVHARRCGRGS